MNFFSISIEIFLLFLTFLILRNYKYLSKKFNFIDCPSDKSKVHKIPISNIGGLSCLIPFLISVIYSIYFEQIFSSNFLTILIIASISFFSMGKFDDDKNLSPSLKTFLLISLFITFIILENNLLIKNLNFKFIELNIYTGSASIFITLFCVIIFFNALNFADGLNGIFASLSIYYILMLIFLTETNSIIMYAIIGCLFIFLIYNLMGKIFIGNSGNSFVSMVIASFYIYIYNTKGNIAVDEIFFIFLIPGLDAVRVAIERIYLGKSPLCKDNNHLHHLLMKRIDIKLIWVFYFLLSMLPYLLLIATKNFYLTLSFSFLIYFFLYFQIRKNINI